MGFMEFQMIGLNPMFNHNQHVSINCYYSGLTAKNFGKSQGSVQAHLVSFTTLIITLIYYVWVTL